MKKNLLLFLALLAFALPTQAQTTPTWLRYPALSPDGSTIVFTYKGDLWKVGCQRAADAMPLTLHEAQDFMPVWSRDGKSQSPLRQTATGISMCS